MGDINGDGINDMAVGASNDDDGATDTGALWFMFIGYDGAVMDL